MKSNENAVIYSTEQTARELNKVKGFDPLKFARNTENGAVLDLPYQKLWFRLRHPNGKIRLFIRNISDEISAVEARVYFDRRDLEPASNHIVSGVNAEDKNAVANAQRSAMENALTDAGFGLQFISANPNDIKNVSESVDTVTKPQHAVEQSPTVIEETKIEPSSQPEVLETIKEAIIPNTPQTVVAEEKSSPANNDPLLSIVNTIESNGIKINTQTGEVIAESATESLTEDISTPTAASVPYDKTTPVEEICAVMSLEEALNYVIVGGPYNGWKMSTIAERRPTRVLEMIIEKYPVQDNILRAATKIILDSKK